MSNPPNPKTATEYEEIIRTLTESNTCQATEIQQLRKQLEQRDKRIEGLLIKANADLAGNITRPPRSGGH